MAVGVLPQLCQLGGCPNPLNRETQTAVGLLFGIYGLGLRESPFRFEFRRQDELVSWSCLWEKESVRRADCRVLGCGHRCMEAWTHMGTNQQH